MPAGDLRCDGERVRAAVLHGGVPAHPLRLHAALDLPRRERRDLHLRSGVPLGHLRGSAVLGARVSRARLLVPTGAVAKRRR